jgi:hypothetical protein
MNGIKVSQWKIDFSEGASQKDYKVGWNKAQGCGEIQRRVHIRNIVLTLFVTENYNATSLYILS